MRQRSDQRIPDKIPGAATLAGYHPFHATRADLLRRLGRDRESRAAYDRAIALTANPAETAALTRRRDRIG